MSAKIDNNDITEYFPRKGSERDESRLHDFLFHFNHLTKKWNAIPREQFLKYWNGIGEDEPKILESSSISFLIQRVMYGDTN